MRYNVIFYSKIASEASKDYHYELTCDRFHRKLSLCSLDHSVRPHLKSLRGRLLLNFQKASVLWTPKPLELH